MENIINKSECYLSYMTTTAKKKMKCDTILAMQRSEIKYILTKEQLEYFKNALVGHMEIDQYGKTSIESLYLDTPDYRLIRTSIEKPAYKEKIRIRSYGLADKDTTVYLEIKRKSCGLVYKRRIPIKEYQTDLIYENHEVMENSQIAKEINYFVQFYKELKPALLIIYDRVAYFEPDSDLRLTIDENPRYRTDNLTLHSSLEGEPLLENGGAILEIKVQESMPLWLIEILSKGKIYKSSFSKVGTAYQKEMIKKLERKQ